MEEYCMKPIMMNEKLMYATLRLESNDTAATGFIYSSSKGNYIVVSNRHFAEKKELDQLDYSKSTLKEYVEFNIHLDDDSNFHIKDNVVWYLHPTIDLAFFQLNPLLAKNLPNIAPKKFNIISLDSSIIPSQNDLDNLTATENVLMCGYPNGQYDTVNNFPIIRSGITSSHPSVDFNGEKKGIVDIPCIPGSSGSPIMIINEGIYFQKSQGNICGSRIYFLGIEHASPMRYINELVQKMPDPTNPQNSIFVSINNIYIKIDMSLGIYIKASEINGFATHFKNLGI